MFARLGRWCFTHRYAVIGLWVAAAVLGGAVLGTIGTKTRTEFSLPDVESRNGIEVLDEHFGGQGAGFNGSIVFLAEDGVDDPAVRSTMEALFVEVDQIESVRVVSPYTDEGQAQIARQGPLAGQVAYASIELPNGVTVEEAEVISHEMHELLPDVDGLQIEIGGEIFAPFEEPTAELVGLAFAIVILIVAFGSVLAMGLPIGVALAGISVGLILAGFLSHLVEVPDFAQMLGVMLGLGVGIDYALFIVTRFRENRRLGHDIERSVVVAIDTAGRAVSFAGATVVISLLGMLLMQLGFITGLAVSAATVVAVTMVASLTLLPALIGVVGAHIEVTRWRGVIAAGLVSASLLGLAFGVEQVLLVALPLAAIVLVAGFAIAPLRAELPHREHPPVERTIAFRWSRWIQHHPWPAALGGAALLLVLAIPVLGLRLGFADEGNFPEDTTTRRAYDLIADGFGPGYNGRLVLAAEVPAGVDPDQLDAVTAAIGQDAGVAAAIGPILNDPVAPTAVIWQVLPATAPQDEATSQLVHRLRDDVVPPLAEASGLDVFVSGAVAMNVDFTDYLGARLAIFFAAVLILSFLLLMVVFRSLLVPLKAVVMNLLGIGAAYGVIVAIFQWGWFGSVLGLAGAPVEPFMPMMLFAIVFGLSMDYEVFLLSRIKEEWDRTGDSHLSVANGLAATARVITAAAAIMIVVFGAFALSDMRVIKMAGIGLAVAVFLDATVIRMLLVPATMELLGDRNWWLPRWLDRILPRIDVEGHDADVDAVGPGALPDEDAIAPELESV
ncbi:MAG: MMPL family transporter [Acidimicrobiales bacterium]